MRLLHSSTLKLRDFIGDDVPPYAILSHTWGDEEVSLQAFEMPESRDRAGFKKIVECCRVAESDGFEYVWIDTCCIDKSSSAELSEAINSMYRWYGRAKVCYAYLSDVTLYLDDALDPPEGRFEDSRWFQRGWTLQELLAPPRVIFLDRDWHLLGTRNTLEPQIRAVCRISENDMLCPLEASIAAKMSWASKRKTTRSEDIAYCLLGLFDINMPLLYGEGHKAFTRLQHEIIRNSSDESIYAWTDTTLIHSGMLARSPDNFSNSGNITRLDFSQLGKRSFTVSNFGLTIELQCEENASLDSSESSLEPDERTWWVAPLACWRGSSVMQKAPVVLHLTRREEGICRVGLDRLESFSKLTRPVSLQFYTRVFHIPDVLSSRRELPAAVLDRTSPECLLPLMILYPSYLTVLRIAGGSAGKVHSGNTIVISSPKLSHERVIFVEFEHESGPHLAMIFEGYRRHSTSVEICWMQKKENSYRGWLDYLDSHSFTVYPDGTSIKRLRQHENGLCDYLHVHFRQHCSLARSYWKVGFDIYQNQGSEHIAAYERVSNVLDKPITEKASPLELEAPVTRR